MSKHLEGLEKTVRDKPAVYKLIKHQIAVHTAREPEAIKALGSLVRGETISMEQIALLSHIPALKGYEQLAGSREILDKYRLLELKTRKSIYLTSLQAEKESILKGLVDASVVEKSLLEQSIETHLRLISKLDDSVEIIEAIIKGNSITFDDRAHLSSIEGFARYQSYGKIRYVDSDFEEFDASEICAIL